MGISFGAVVPAARSAAVAEDTLLARYRHDFECRLADEPELRRRAFETRYQVYCVENRFENPDEHLGGLETDEYDSCSRHCVLIYRPTGQIIGTVRLILPVGGMLSSFSMQGIVQAGAGKLALPLSRTAEVSRFSISKRSRDLPSRSLSQQAGAVRRAEPLMSLGLIQGLVHMSALHGITHWCAVMEPKLLRMLAAMGIHFTPVGEPVEHHGLRQFSYCEIGAMLESMKKERPSFWEIVTDSDPMMMMALAS
jgi:N-acyl amino acid synthase of PEP-CTERM/exosortase system